MKRVQQEDDDGCGIATVATLAKKSYWTARKVMDGQWEYGSTTEQLRAALKRFGIRSAERKRIGRRGYEALPFDAALHGRLQDGGKVYWHWTVWDSGNGKLLDPYRPTKTKFTCTSFVRIFR